MALIERLRRDGNSTIAILGAGNCNDLDLASLADNFRAVHLIDLDREALSHGLRSQATTGDTRLHCHAPADITDPEFTLDPPVDVVVSCCVFSQIVDAAANDGLPAAALNDRVLDLRRRHFELLLHSVPEAGTAIFVSDCVSSETLPELLSLPPQKAGAALHQAITERNFFTGLNPHAIAAMLRREPSLRTRIRDLHFVSPWVWRLSERSARLTYAFLILKHPFSPVASTLLSGAKSSLLKEAVGPSRRSAGANARKPLRRHRRGMGRQFEDRKV